MDSIAFSALEHRRDGGFAPVELRFEGDTARGYEVFRNGESHLLLGPGYRLVKTLACGVCSTDLDRRYLPFELPQVIGHEAVVTDEGGARYVVEINASHQALGSRVPCSFCDPKSGTLGLARHCPERLVLGIDRLPGGFGPYLLAPVRGLVAIPEHLSTATATLLEPFAAALQAVGSLRTLAEGGRSAPSVAVLGTRRLGLLVVAALAAHRRATRGNFEVVALSRHPRLLEIARRLGADRGELLPAEAAVTQKPAFDCVVDTTGTPSGLSLAVELAIREVHLKSTHGQTACGLTRLTELVVDELSLSPVAFADTTGAPPLLAHGSSEPGSSALCDSVVVDSSEGVDGAILPAVGSRGARVRPRGTIYIHPRAASDPSRLVARIARGELSLTSSRCGDFHQAVGLFSQGDLAENLGKEMITHHFSAGELTTAFEVASSSDCIKGVVQH